jgi:hypothetical protein
LREESGRRPGRFRLRASADDPAAALLGCEAARKPWAPRVQQLSRTEVGFKKLHSDWDRLRHEFAFATRRVSTRAASARSRRSQLFEISLEIANAAKTGVFWND